jgi:hypothetical protein
MNKKGMNAGNKNAEHIDEVKAMKIMDKIYDYILNNEECKSIQEAARKTGSHCKIVPYLKFKFKGAGGVDFLAIQSSKRIIKTRLKTK